MRILITGSKGCIGTQLVKILKDRGHSVFEIDLTHEPGEVGWEHEMGSYEFTYSRCDIADFRQLQRIFEKAGPFDFVYQGIVEITLHATDAIPTRRQSCATEFVKPIK